MLSKIEDRTSKNERSHHQLGQIIIEMMVMVMMIIMTATATIEVVLVVIILTIVMMMMIIMLVVITTSSNNDSDNNSNNDNETGRHSLRFVQSGHCTVNCLRNALSHGQGAVVCKLCSTYRALIMYNMSCDNQLLMKSKMESFLTAKFFNTGITKH